MKKLLLLTILTLISSCEISTKYSRAPKPTVKKHVKSELSLGNYAETRFVKFYKDNMEYYVFSSYNGGIVVINHTKEKLEVEILKKQLLIK